MKKILSVLLTAVLVLSLAACGSSPAPAPAPAPTPSSDAGSSTPAPAPAPAGNELITVGVINNDPNESGYRTANDAAMRATFTEANG